MSHRAALLLFIVIAGLSFTTLPAAQDTGSIEGRLVHEDGAALGGVSVVVVIDEAPVSTVTDVQGAFRFSGVPAGTYTLTFSLGDRRTVVPDVAVASGETARVEATAEWGARFTDHITVFAASRRQERIVEAPAAVTSLGEDRIEREAAHGQLPKLLEFTPGVEVTQSGLYDYNLNTRGFNSSLNRRVAVLIDGRDPSVPFFGSQEWGIVSSLDDLAGMEFVRGPSAALYGANASSGVLSMTTRAPRYSQGGRVRLTAGELSTVNADLRYADALGGRWYFKVNAGVRDGDDFSRSRHYLNADPVEYSVPCGFPPVLGETDCLPQEAVPLALDDDRIEFGNLRLDRYMAGGGVLTLEGGTAEYEGPVAQTGIGRFQLIEVERPWARANYNAKHWNLLAYFNRRDAPRSLNLGNGTNNALDSENVMLEVQTNWEFARERARVVAGAAYGEEEIDSRDPDTGLQTSIFEPVDSDQQALFAQLDLRLGERVRIVLAGRWDDSSLHDSRVSPKGSIVYSVRPSHALRLSYVEAFQVANYSELFLNTPIASTPTDPLEGICLLSGVLDCGLAGTTPIVALGNDDLDVEKIRMLEVGYSGIFGGTTWLTIDVYDSRNRDFITDLLPQLGTSLGRINPDFGPWVGSDAAETTPANPVLGFPVGTTVADAIRASAPALSNNLDGANILAGLSYTNFGEVDTRGVDVGLNRLAGKRWRWSVNYSWFDFDIGEELPGFGDLLLPNTPEHKAGASLTWLGERTEASLAARWVDGFRWSAGIYSGDVESYTTADLNVRHTLNDHWTIGATVANLLDDEHWETFGGDILGRRALAYLLYSWD